MLVCVKCGAPLRDGAGFCQKCGAAVETSEKAPESNRVEFDPAAGIQPFCSFCGAPLRNGAGFCPKCGRPTHKGEAELPQKPWEKIGKPAFGGRTGLVAAVAALSLVVVTLTVLLATGALSGGSKTVTPVSKYSSSSGGDDSLRDEIAKSNAEKIQNEMGGSSSASSGGGNMSSGYTCTGESGKTYSAMPGYAQITYKYSPVGEAETKNGLWLPDLEAYIDDGVMQEGDFEDYPGREVYYELYQGLSICQSNELRDDKAVIKVHEGLLIVFETKD